MSLFTIVEVQALGVGLALSDAALQAAIDREEAELVCRFGAASTARTERVKGGGQSVFLARAVSSVSSITEYYYRGDPTGAALVSTDYDIWGDEGRIERVNTASRWGAFVSVTYTPVDDTSLRKTVLLELIRIGTEEPASGGGESVAGLGFSVGSGGKATDFASQRSLQYSRLGWLDR